MKPFLRAVLAIAAIIAITTLHIAWVTVFPYPISALNIITIALVYLLLVRRIAVALAAAFAVGLTIELYAVTPFGLLLGALLIAFIASAFFASRILTTNSFWGSVALCFFMVVVNRITFVVLLTIVGFTQGEVAAVSLQFMESMIAEGIVTTIAAAVLFALLPLPHRVTTVRITTSYGVTR